MFETKLTYIVCIKVCGQWETDNFLHLFKTTENYESEEEETQELSQFVTFVQDLVIQLNNFKSVLIHSDLLLTY